MAKGFLAILTGRAIDDGYLESEDQLISTVFPEYKKALTESILHFDIF
ncbi:hypothetical protein [Chryseobacterium mulctrae]|nr:hypothetical protein [Chryseobacterium mulctrae]